ncbi:hypothetical protein F1728_04230 [Gimesia benthica]|uniref:Sacsin/Nov domain-containing protein n=1 Tax=Gimesia benthica TaxID=2608982 RepID=A0A6I6A995_9PLAN|nr:hypothetical protein [Gimesia benthica]QGQ21945.1 hypothetical protein F1728_04230 [Gimesia benthica]
MTIDFEKICSENIKDYGEKTHHLSFLGNLYADRTHFIYELLQNAEDAKASEINFHLKAHCLEVSHNGRLFNEEDVRGICGVGDGTKSEDLTQIGTFGIGFKSVYGYTLKPEIHCGDNHFCIEHYVRPHQIAVRKIPKPFSTLFVFPFDRENEELNQITSQEAFDEISDRLKSLGIRTLLFLKNLEQISFIIEGGSSGSYLRENEEHETHSRVKVIGQKNEEEVDEQWLIFSKSLPDPYHDLKTEIAFHLKTKEGKKNSHEIVPIQSSLLTVFFPTDQETHLGFLVQGPFKTTPARDNIPKQNEWNKNLVLVIRDLLSETLHVVKDLGLLSVSFLECLPIRDVLLHDEWLVGPLYEATKNAFEVSELLPTDDGSFTRSCNAKISRTKDLRSLINTHQLTEMLLSKEKIKWITGHITRDKNQELYDYFEDHLSIEEITPEKFAGKLSEVFLAQQSDEWFIQLYEFLSGQNALWRAAGNYKEGLLRRKPFIKCQDDMIRPPFEVEKDTHDEVPVVFLPVKTEVDVPLVKWRIYHNQKAKEFLERDLRLNKPDICAEVMQNVLGKFESHSEEEFKSLKENYQDYVDQISEAFNLVISPQNSELRRRLMSTPWILSRNAKTGDEKFLKANAVYLASAELEQYFRDNGEAWFVCEDYQHERTILTELGVKHSPGWMHRQSLFYCNKYQSAKIDLVVERGSHRRGLKCFDPDAEVFGLEHALKNITPGLSVYIWNEIACKYSKFIRGQIETATRQDFSNAETEDLVSKFGKLLDSTKWIKTKTEWKVPSECRIDELPREFKVEDKIVDALGIKPSDSEEKQNRIIELQEVLGVNQNDASFIMELINEPSRLSELQLVLKKPSTKPPFPERSSKNPERRSGKVKEQQERAGSRSYETRERSVRVSQPLEDSKEYLRDLYTNDDDKMICQMCENEMPFRLLNGKYYFEAVQVNDNYPEEVYQLNLALCPVCAAKYKYILKKDDAALEKFVSSLDGIESPSFIFDFSIENGVNHSIRFVELHLEDVRTILNNHLEESV